MSKFKRKNYNIKSNGLLTYYKYGEFSSLNFIVKSLTYNSLKQTT